MKLTYFFHFVMKVEKTLTNKYQIKTKIHLYNINFSLCAYYLSIQKVPRLR